MKKLLLSILWLIIPTGLFAQITIDESLTTQELVQDVLIGGSCAETANFVSSTGTDFGDVNGIAAFDANGSDFPFQSGVILSSGSVANAPGPNLSTQNEGSWPGDADLEANTTATNTNNASFIQFEFTPLTESLSFNFIMASEEYDQNFECDFSDAFAFILTDIAAGTSENLAVLPGTNIPIQVTNIRPEVPGQCAAVNEEFFDRYNFLPFNDENTSATNFNGQTVVLTASSSVIPGTTYAIKLVVADELDNAFDIAVFLEAGSFNVGATDLGEDILVANGNAPCEGNEFNLDATDPNAISYTWFFNDVEIEGETEPLFIVEQPGTYSVEVLLSEPEGCVITDSIEVEFITSESVNIDDLNACEDTPGSFDTGLPADNVTFEWTLDGTVIAGETGPSILATNEGTYEVTATFDGGCAFTDSALSTIITNPTVDLGDDINSCLETPITLDGTPSNVDPAASTYQWTLNGTALNGETNATIEVTQQGTYAVFVTLDGCTGTDVVIVNLANPDGSSCSINDTCPDSIPLVCGDVVTGNTESSTSEGAPSGTCGTGPGAPGNWYSFVGTGEQVELATCNSNYDTKIQVYSGSCDALECIDGNDDSCGLQSEVDFLGEEGVTYFIYVFGFGSSTGDYELTLVCSEPPIIESCFDAEPFCSDDGLIFENVSDGSTAEEGIDYECLGSQPNPSWFFLEIEEAGDLDLEIVQNTEFDENGNPVGTPLDVDFIAWGPFDSVEAGCGNLNPVTSVDCSFSAAPIENFTIPNAMVGELYIVLITNFNGSAGFISLGQTGGTGSTNCDIVQEFVVDLGEDQTFCTADTPEFEITPVITGEDLGEPTFLWSTGETTETIIVSSSGVYTVEVTIDGFTASDEITITFVDNPTLDLGPDQIICDNESIVLVPATNGNAADFTYDWSTGETTETITVSNNGVYTLTITSIEGCSTTDTVTVSIGDPVSVNAGEDFTTCRNFTSTLNATIGDPDATVQWFLNGNLIDGATSTTLEFLPEDSAFGVQEYTIEVTSTIGCTSSDSVEVSLYEVGQCVISEGLSPTNIDGFNDTLDLTFLADRTGITNLQIFNRLGALVFEQNSYINQWRGQTDAGDNLPTGTYFYVINFDSEDPEYGNQATGWIYVNQEAR